MAKSQRARICQGDHKNCYIWVCKFTIDIKIVTIIDKNLFFFKDFHSTFGNTGNKIPDSSCCFRRNFL